MPSRAVLLLFVTACLLTSASTAVAAPTTTLIGAAAPGSFTALPTPVDDSSIARGAVSQDGRFVAFASGADGLSDENDDRVEAIYVKDRFTGAVELVSRATGTHGLTNAEGCTRPSISANGSRIAFVCEGALEPSDTNGHADIYVRDRDAATTMVVSHGPGTQADAGSDDPQISGAGNHVAFTSAATNIVSGSPANGTHVFRRTLASSVVMEMDLANGAAVPNGPSQGPSISSDGSRVAFSSDATNLATGTDANGAEDVYVRDAGTGTTILASTINGNSGLAANGAAFAPSISGNGLHVAYSSVASNIADGDADASTDIHRRTLGSATVVLVDRATGAAGAKADGVQVGPAISDNGDTVTFVSDAKTLGAPAGSRRQAYVRRVGAATTELASRSSGAGGHVSGVDVHTAAVSGDGGTVVMDARGLTDDGDPLARAVFARNLASSGRFTTLVSRPSGSASFVNTGGSASLGPGSLSADGRFAVFTAAAPGLPGQPAGGIEETWRRDTTTGAVELVSRAGGNGDAADADTAWATISADGTRVAFVSAAPDLGGVQGVYVRDLVAQTTTLVSRVGDAAAPDVTDATISADGRHAAFVYRDGASGRRHIAVADLVTGASVPIALGQAGDSSPPRLSADGSRVVWAQTVYGDGVTPTSHHVWWAEVADGAPHQIDAGAPADAAGTWPSISSDGRRAAFVTEAPLGGGDSGLDPDAYVRDLDASGFTRVSTGNGMGAEISGDGEHVAFRAPRGPGLGLAGYVRDLGSGTTTLVSRADGEAGAPVSDHVDAISIDDDGGCVAFQTQDTGLAASLSPGADRVWLRALRGTCSPDAPAAQAPAPAPIFASPAAAHRPVVGRVTATPARFSTRGREGGTTLRFTVDQAAKLQVVFARATKGHRVGRRCRPGAPKGRQKHCTVLRTVTALRRTGRRGPNRVAFTGIVRGKRLPKGSYVATVTARTAAGASAPRTVKLRVG